MMARARTKEGRSEAYKDLARQAAELGEGNDCVVKMLALACNVPYAEAHKACVEAGRKKGGRMAMGDWEPLFEKFGHKLVRVDKRSKISQYPSTAAFLKNITTHQPERFPEVWRDGKTYVFRCSGHVATIINGRNHDWTIGKSHRAIAVYEVVRNG